MVRIDTVSQSKPINLGLNATLLQTCFNGQLYGNTAWLKDQNDKIAVKVSYHRLSGIYERTRIDIRVFGREIL